MYYAKQRRQLEYLKLMEARHQQEMLEASHEAQEIVKRQIGGDLHDDIGTLLSATRLSITQLYKASKDTETTSPYFDRTNALLNEAISNVRRLSKDLTPATLDEFGLVIALEDFAKKISTNTGVQMNVTLEDETECFDKKIELPLYRITQELVNNSLNIKFVIIMTMHHAKISKSLLLHCRAPAILDEAQLRNTSLHCACCHRQASEKACKLVEVGKM